MNIKGYRILTIILLMCVLSGLTVNSSAKLKPEQESLRGINAITIDVSCSQDAKEAGLNEEDIGENIRKQLEEAGIKIMPSQAWGRVPGRCRVRIRIKTYQPPRQELFIYNLEFHLLQTVVLERNPKTKIDAATWELTWLAHGYKNKLAEAIPANLKLMANSFVRDYRQANPQGGKLSDANDINDVSVTDPKEQIRTDAKSTVAEYKYVASKNSKVFHKPECRWAKRIKPENLVGYNSRDKAIKAGKRPCKLCKP